MIRKLKYILMDPTGNRTILVDTPVPEDEHPAVAAKLMEKESAAEQVGFLSFSGNREYSLRMAGGEFCGNAAMSAAVYRGMLTGQKTGEIVVKVSGAPEPVRVKISARDDGSWQGIVEMPRPRSIEIIRFPEGPALPVVSFSGISHVILEQKLPEREAERFAKSWCGYLKADALGLMFLDKEQGRLSPLVYVPAADTLFWESSCGSGTSAVGAWLAKGSGKPVKIPLQQPGGILEISAEPNGPLFLKGTVRCLYNKETELEWQESGETPS